MIIKYTKKILVIQVHITWTFVQHDFLVAELIDLN